MKINWVLVISIAAAVLFAFLYFRTCNVPIVSNTHVEDSLRVVAKTKDSIYKIKSDSGYHKLDSLSKHDSIVVAKYNGLRPQINAVNQKNAALQDEIERLKNSTSVDSLNKALADLNRAYQEVFNLLNQTAADCDSVELASSDRYKQASLLLTQASDQIKDLQGQRDAALADDHSKDSIINKLVKQKKANNIWAKISSVGLVLVAAVAILK